MIDNGLLKAEKEARKEKARKDIKRQWRKVTKEEAF